MPCPIALIAALAVTAAPSIRISIGGPSGSGVATTASLGIVALAAGVQGWALRRTTLLERAMLIAAGVLLVYPGATADVVGVALVFAALAMQWFGRSAPQNAT